MTSPFFAATIELIRRDADFADKIWHLYTNEAARPDQLRHELGVKISRVFDLDADEAARWLSYHVEDVVEYYGAHYPYGGHLHKRSGAALLIRIIKNGRIPSRSELSTSLVTLCNMFFTVLCPLLFLCGALQSQPVFPWVDRPYFMGGGIVIMVLAKISKIDIKNPRQFRFTSEMERRYGFKFIRRIFGPSTPLRVSLSSEVIGGIGKNAVFYAAGTFLNEAYTVLELIFAIIAGMGFLYDILNYIYIFLKGSNEA